MTETPDPQLGIERRIRVRDVAFGFDELFGVGAGEGEALHYCFSESLVWGLRKREEGKGK